MNTQDFVNQHADKVPERFEFLQLMIKDKETGKKSFTGKHLLKIVSDERTTSKDYMSFMREVIRYKFIEKLGNGTKKNVQYDIPCWAKDKEGKEIHYLIPKMAEFVEGDVITMEMIPNGIKTFVEIHRYRPDDVDNEEEAPKGEEPIIDLNDEFPLEEDLEALTDEIDIKDIPF